MLSKEAIQHIEAQAVAAAGIRVTAQDGADLLLVPDNYKIHNLERYQEFRNRLRGALNTHSVKDFSDYVQKQNLEEGPRGFIDQESMSAIVIFNLGDAAHPAGHGDNTARLTLKPTAAFTAVSGIAGRQLSQQQLAEWLEDWLPNLVAQANSADLNMLQAINGIRRMTIQATAKRDTNVSDFGASRSAMDEIEAKSQETLASSFTFTTVPYEGLQPAAIQLRLSVITGKDEPVLKLRWVGEEAQREGFAREFKELLNAEVGGFVPLTLGTYQLGQ
jgi:uncharacterized protein YfdQ (DUF2303 family)